MVGIQTGDISNINHRSNTY